MAFREFREGIGRGGRSALPRSPSFQVVVSYLFFFLPSSSSSRFSLFLFLLLRRWPIPFPFVLPSDSTSNSTRSRFPSLQWLTRVDNANDDGTAARLTYSSRDDLRKYTREKTSRRSRLRSIALRRGYTPSGVTNVLLGSPFPSLPPSPDLYLWSSAVSLLATTDDAAERYVTS